MPRSHVHELLHDVRLIVLIGINIKNKTNGVQYKTGTQGVGRKRGPSSINTLTVPTNADTRQLVSLPCRLLRRASVPLPRTSDRLFPPLKSGQSMPLVPILRVWSIMGWETLRDSKRWPDGVQAWCLCSWSPAMCMGLGELAVVEKRRILQYCQCKISPC
jgi:hypothetical protein